MLQGTANAITSARAFAKSSDALPSSLKVFKKLEKSGLERALILAFRKLNALLNAYAAEDVANSSEVKKILVEIFFTVPSDLNFQFDIDDLNHEVGLDYGRKFFTHLTFSFVSKIYHLLQTKVLHFFDDDTASGRTLRFKLNAFVFHMIGQRQLQSIDHGVDPTCHTANAYSDDYFVLHSEDQAGDLRKMYRWEEQYASTTASGEDALLQLFDDKIKKSRFLESKLAQQP